MATPTLTNQITAEQYQSTTLDLTDMVVTDTGIITVSLGIDPVVETLDFLPSTTGNLDLTDLSLGQYQLVGTAAELTADDALTLPIWQTISGERREILRLPPAINLAAMEPVGHPAPHLAPHVGP